ncbi:hypothetical protein Kpho02_04930 [Kitasatospora phosalacinea]|uniref:Uncharacterized protein n=1 Tax=Kitasatospora phosalacinea TaxID=2065 RepID=A0A9W6UY80_9ACTN|nr:hypothetical protein [Kitasatospora phosalacinea]GLW68194.1 hypothetical protein Kpho02_04930 [Kitasatospora phosalacinea]
MTTTSAILGQFDLCADRAEFPDLDNGYSYPVAERLHLFGGRTRWAVVAELLGYAPRDGNLVDVVHRFGNCLTHGEPGFGEFLERVDNMAELDPDRTGRYPGGTPVVVRGTALSVPAAPGTPWQDVFRQLAPAHRPLLLADPAELRTGLPADLPVLLRLDEWNQPEDLGGVMPSEHETFRLIAEVLDSGDPSRYRPALAPNTHWSHWPEAGTL